MGWYNASGTTLESISTIAVRVLRRLNPFEKHSLHDAKEHKKGDNAAQGTQINSR